MKIFDITVTKTDASGFYFTHPQLEISQFVNCSAEQLVNIEAGMRLKVILKDITPYTRKPQPMFIRGHEFSVLARDYTLVRADVV